MLNSLVIKNYRVAECIIEGLGRINLFVGKNNSGKSSALEAICIVKSALANEAFHEPLLKSLLSRRGTERSAYTTRDFWHNYKTDEVISLGLGFEKERTIDVKVTWRNDEGFDISVSKIVPDRAEPLSFGKTPLRDSITYERTWGEVKGVLDEELTNYLQNLILIDDQIARKLERHETMIFGKVLENRLDKKVAQELKKSYEVPAESLSYIPFSPGMPGKTKLAIVTPELSIHIDEMGDGAKYATIILSIALLLKNTALLIEEIESHQHSGAIKKILPSLVEVVTKNNVQLFLTTHSLDVIQTLSSLADAYDIRFFHFEKSQDDVINVRSISKADSKLLSDLGVDLKYLPEKFLVIEGKNDAIFFDVIVNRILSDNLEGLGYFTVVAGNKDMAKQVAAALASTGREITVAVDYNGEHLNDLNKSMRGVLSGKGLKVNPLPVGEGFILPDTGSTVRLIALGLPQDPFLDQIGITQHEMEDYILKLIEIDKNVAGWFSLSLSELVEDAKKAKFEHLNKSKTLLRCAAMKKGMEYEELIKKLIELADEESLRKIATNVFATFTS